MQFDIGVCYVHMSETPIFPRHFLSYAKTSEYTHPSVNFVLGDYLVKKHVNAAFAFPHCHLYIFMNNNDSFQYQEIPGWNGSLTPIRKLFLDDEVIQNDRA